MRLRLALVFMLLWSASLFAKKDDGLPLWYFRHPKFENFGDVLSLKLVERIVERPVVAYKRKPTNNVPKLLAIGSILHIAATDDVVWGSGVNGKDLARKNYVFDRLDVRAVRGPITRKFLMREHGIDVPEVYGDPALLLPYLFPEFQKKEKPSIPYLVIAHYSDAEAIGMSGHPHIAYAWEPWDNIVKKITDSAFVISSSLHGVIIAEAFGIPARLLRLNRSEPILKFADYFLGTGRPNYRYATTIEEALQMGGEAPIQCDLQKLYDSFPFEFWANLQKKPIAFN